MLGVRGDEDKRFKDTNRQRDESVNRREGTALITITLNEPNFSKMGQMIGTMHRMEGITLKGQLFVANDPNALDLILEIDNQIIGKLIERALVDDMKKAIEPKPTTGGIRQRSSEGLKVSVQDEPPKLRQYQGSLKLDRLERQLLEAETN